MKRKSAKRIWCKNWYARPYFEKALRRCKGIFPENANGCRVTPLNYYMRWQLVRFEREFLFFFSCYSVYQVLPGFSLRRTFSVSGFRDAFGGLRAIMRGRNRWIRVLRSRGSWCVPIGLPYRSATQGAKIYTILIVFYSGFRIGRF